ncbi:MAG TPA: ATP-dependent zinc metalloprotease FtsH [Patescibacteria group bacterium]|jgi:cell division protease FtsH|nr:ATP-dependent zinc metalloprotease FtsH [Patescibacteria group bacterium]
MNWLKRFMRFNGGFKNIIILLVITFASLLFLQRLMEMSRHIQLIGYSVFLDKVEKSDIKQVYVDGQEVRGILKDNTLFQTIVPENGVDWQFLRAKGIDFSLSNQADYGYYWYMMVIGILIAIFGGIWFMLKRSQGMGSGSNIFSMGKSKARMFMPSTIKETFLSVAGAEEAKEELNDIIDYLKNPKKYRRLGAKMTRGILLIGEPGNGKTLLARAVAGEANCPFFSVSGSDFIEVFVGVGAARVRDLFLQARRYAPSIIFIDEIDAVGRHRGSGLGGSHDEREQTLNQLLTEMDGFLQMNDTPVIVIAATNRPDVLDKALLRPGRFDRQVHVPFPDLKSREDILKVHASTVKMDPEVDLHKIARGTPGFSGADLANLINKAAIEASKEESDLITVHHLENARDQILLGKEIKSIMLTEEDKRIIAYHESGHALARLLMPECTSPLHKVTIIPRGKALGVTHSMPEREKYITSKEEMEAEVISALGGRAAEEIVFQRLTTGAYSDFKAATDIVRKMVCSYGMVPEELGTILYVQDHHQYQYSEKTSEKIDEAVRTIMENCYKRCIQLFKDNRDKLDLLAITLLEKETMYAGEIYQLLNIEPRVEHTFS